MGHSINPGATFIYGLKCPLTGRVRYVGKADAPEARYRQHLARPTNRASREWITGLSGRGLVPDLVILERVPESDWRRVEAEWIARLRAAGHGLTNVNRGGEQGSQRRRPAPVAGKGRGPHRRFLIDGDRLRSARTRAGLTQPVLAERAGVCVATVSRLERRGGPVFAHTLTRLAGALGVDRGGLSCA